MKKLIQLCFLCLILWTQQVIAAPLPKDPLLSEGALDNGMQYIIYPHANPKGKMHLWLVVKAGSLDEENDQSGVAHLLEHMLFNGLRDYPGNAVITELEKMGLRFGRDVNAYTNYAETVYMISLPAHNEATLDKVMNVFKNWAAYALIDDRELEQERGVVTEEWRSSQGSKWRVHMQRRAFLQQDSRYLVREPIGDMEIIRTVPQERVKAFYRDWYQPHNMTFVVSGDVMPEMIIPKIRQIFASLPDRASPPQVPRTVPAVAYPRYNIISETENSVNTVSLTIRYPQPIADTVAAFQADQANRLIVSLFNQRMQDLTQKNALSNVIVKAAVGQLGSNYQTLVISAVANKDQQRKAAEVLWREIARLDRDGFTEAELARQKKNMLLILDSAIDNGDARDSGLLMRRLAAYAIQGNAFLSPHQRYDLAEAAFGQLGLQTVNARWNTLRAHPDYIIEQLVRKAGIALPKAEMETLIHKAKTAVLPPYRLDVRHNVLLEEIPETGEIIQTQKKPAGMTELMLANGAKVVMLPTKLPDNEIQIRAVSAGGALRFQGAEYHLAGLASRAVDLSGLGLLDAFALKDWQTANRVRFSTAVEPRQVTLSVSADKNHLESGFQLLHQRFQSQRIDPAIAATLKQAMARNLQQNLVDPQQRYEEMLSQLRYQDPRALSLDEKTLDSFGSNDFQAIDHSLFSNAADFIFVIVGNVDLARVEALAAQYIATLPGQPPPVPVYALARNAQGQQQTLRAGLAPYAHVTQYRYRSLAQPVTEKTRLNLQAFSYVLSQDLRRGIREQASGAYSVGSIAYLGVPDQEFFYRLSFSCQPERADELRELAEKLIAQRVAKGITQTELDEFIRNQRHDIAQLWQSNSNLGRALAQSYLYYGDASLLTGLNKRLDALSVREINQLVQQLFAENTQVTGVLLPDTGLSN